MAFYRIKDAAEKIGVLPHVLRFWEAQFPSLKPQKTTRGQRLYSDEDIENFLKIKHLLYNEGYSISGAKKALKEERSSQGSGAFTAAEVEFSRQILEDLLGELKKLQEFSKEI